MEEGRGECEEGEEVCGTFGAWGEQMLWRRWCVLIERECVCVCVCVCVQELVNYYYSTFDSNRSGLQALYRDASLLTWMGEQVRRMDIHEPVMHHVGIYLTTTVTLNRMHQIPFLLLLLLTTKTMACVLCVRTHIHL